MSTMTAPPAAVRAPRLGSRTALMISGGVYAVAATTVLALSVLRRIPLDRGLEPDPLFRQRDFRDTVFLPVRDLLGGHNPYDVAGYLLRHPQAQEFNLYAPGHLLLVLPVGILPLPVSAAVWTVLLLVALPVLVRWSAAWIALPLSAGAILAVTTMLLASPVVLLSMSLGQVSLLLALGVVVALAGPVDRWWTSAAAAAAMVKPQFALPLVIALVACGRWRVALRGALGMIALSLPVLIACAVAAGGPVPLLRSLLDNLSYSRAAPTTAADAATSTRVDLVGTLARLGVSLPALVELGLIIVVLAIGGIAVRRAARRVADADADASVEPAAARRSRTLLAVSVAALFALGLPFSAYDLPVALPALLAAVAAAVRFPEVAAVLMASGIAVPFLHVRTVERALSLGGPVLVAADGAGLLLAGAVAAVALVATPPTTGTGG
jgi:hypothetical protein